MMTTATPDIAQWYLRYRASVRGAAAYVTGNPDDADDALHDTFLAAWRARGRFEAGRDPLPWLKTIARRKAISIAAERSKARVAAMPEPLPSAEDEAIRRESDALVRALTQNEPALALHALADLPARAVGERLGVPLRTAASRIRRGRQRLEAALPATTLSSPRSKLA